MKILVTGSRVFEYSADELSKIWELEQAIAYHLTPLDLWDSDYGMPTGDVELIVGDCPTGMDLIARDWAMNSWVRFTEFHADWESHGRRAGPMRNQEMVNTRPDLCLAFPLVLDSWSGTMDCMFRADAYGVPVYVNGTTRWTRADFRGTVPSWVSGKQSTETNKTPSASAPAGR